MKLCWPDLILPPINLWSIPAQFIRKRVMSLTTEDINDRLRQVSEIDLLEILEITSEDLVDRFQDKIESKRDYLHDDLEA